MTTPQQIGPYRIQAEIGRGGMAVVYRAADARTGTVVALKVLPPHLAHDERYLQRFEREGKSAARLRHPNIVRTLDTGAADGYHFLALEYVEGQTLADLLRTQRTLLPTADVVSIIRQVAEGLDYAHNLGVLHRDIKTSNIMIDRDGKALLMDFGVAKLLDEDHTAYTIVGTTVGTPAFMAPEQARGGEVDRRADIYSLGVIAYSLFTGVMPFKADSQPALLHKIVYEPPLQPEEVNQALPPGVIYALKKVLAKSPSARYPTATDFAQALAKGLTWAPSSGELRAVQERMLVTATSQSQVAVKTTQTRRRSGGGILLGLAALIAAIAAVTIFLNPPAWLSQAPDSAIAVALDAFQAQDGTFRLRVPDAWTPGSAANSQGVLYTFDASDRVARLFAVRLVRPPATNDAAAARKAVTDFLASSELPYTEVTPNGAGAERQHSSGQYFYEQTAAAEWLGRPVALHVSALPGADSVYLVGLVVESAQAATFAPLRQAVVDSLHIDLAPIAQFLPTVTDAPALDATANLDNAGAAPTAAATTAATPLPQDTPTATPIPSNTPTATPVPTDTPPPSDTPTSTATLRPTATPLPTSMTTATPSPDVAATRTQEARLAETAVAPLPIATRTPSPTATSLPTATATRTPTATSTPNFAATQTVEMRVRQTSVAATLTAIAPKPTSTLVQAPTATRRATSTPAPTATRTPVRISTATPNLAATETADARRIATALAQTLTALPTPTSTATTRPTATPSPTITATSTPAIVLTPPTPDVAALDATAAAIQTALAALQATPTPSISPLDATSTAISQMLTELAPTASAP